MAWRGEARQGGAAGSPLITVSQSSRRRARPPSRTRRTESCTAPPCRVLSYIKRPCVTRAVATHPAKPALQSAILRIRLASPCDAAPRPIPQLRSTDLTSSGVDQNTATRHAACYSQGSSVFAGVNLRSSPISCVLPTPQAGPTEPRPHCRQELSPLVTPAGARGGGHPAVLRSGVSAPPRAAPGCAAPRTAVVRF